MLLAVFLASGKAAAIEFEVTLPIASPAHYVVLPGETTFIEFDVSNVDSTAGVATPLIRSQQTFPEFYSFGPGEPAQCGSPTHEIYLIDFLYRWIRWRFPVSLAAGESVRCRYPLTRSMSALADANSGLCIGRYNNLSTSCENGAAEMRTGVLPDIGIHVEPLTPLVIGSTESLMRITLENPSVAATAPIRIQTTSCRPMTSLSLEEMPYVLEGNLADACGVRLDVGCGVGFGVPPPFYRWELTLPSASAGSTSSCLVRMRFPGGLQSPILDTLRAGLPGYAYAGVPLAFQQIGTGIDWNISNNTAPFGATPQNLPVPVDDRIALGALALLLGWFGCRTRMRSRSAGNGRRHEPLH